MAAVGGPIETATLRTRCTRLWRQGEDQVPEVVGVHEVQARRGVSVALVGLAAARARQRRQELPGAAAVVSGKQGRSIGSGGLAIPDFDDSSAVIEKGRHLDRTGTQTRRTRQDLHR